MKQYLLILSVLFSQNYQIQPITFTNVQLHDQFWAPIIKRNAEITLPYLLDKNKESGRLQGSTLYKTIEGASYILQINKNSTLEQYLDTLIIGISKMQAEDGYISTFPVDESERWGGVDAFGGKGGANELYSSGHLFEAAVAHYLATGKRNLLNIATKNADLIVKVFGWGKIERFPTHPEIELALVRLYQATGRKEYLELAQFFLDVRGPNGSEYTQSHQKIVDQHEAVGHSVQAMYLYSGITDIFAYTNIQKYESTVNAIWENMVNKKLYITGGIGSNGIHEGFEEAYKLPNMTAYNETCASIASVFWNQRMFMLNGDARYIDIIERTMYNAILSGVSMSGDRFFYPNPLSSIGQYQRASWYGVPCCPPNLLRFLGTIPGYIYAQKDNDLYVNLFIGSTGIIKMSNGLVKVTQTTDFPWQGNVELKLSPDRPSLFTVKVRVPSWARDKPVPGTLYRFMENENKPLIITINGKPIKYNVEKGYAVLNRKWNADDTININLPLDPKKVLAHPKVEANTGRFAFQRGPLVYALEAPDHQEGQVRNIMISPNSEVKISYKENILNGTHVLESEGISLKYQQNSDTISRIKRPITAIPYYLWANRGPHEMTVWIPYKESVATPIIVPLKTLASTSLVRASGGSKNLDEINNQYVFPLNQHLPKVSGYFRWPLENKDKIQWVQYIFEKPSKVSSVKVYWFDNKPMVMTTWYDNDPWPRCRVPDSWKLYYRDQGGGWQPVQNKGKYTTKRDSYNLLEFNSVKTNSLKIEVLRHETFAPCISEWIVNK